MAPLGGLGEFGKNSMVMEWGRDMIMVDCGQKFPDHDMLGVDQVIPEFTYALDAGDRLRGVILTHGHEDHIGAVPFLARQVRDRRLAVYGTRITLAILREKLEEMDLMGQVEMVHVEAGQTIKLGEFEVELLAVPHSFPNCLALAIKTPLGMVVHTGDFRFALDENNGASALESFKRLGGDGQVLLLMSDSTNVDRQGFSPRDELIREGLSQVIGAASRTVILAQFSSNIQRLQSLLDIAQDVGRKVAICGYSLERNFNIATELGLLHYPSELLWPLHELRNLAPEQRLIMTTGTQGEPLAALSRMAFNNFKGYQVGPDDLVVFSSRIIPGNERAIYRVINHFYRRGARVITERDAPVHGSGHAYREEMRELLKAVRPRYFMPIHGELRQLIGHGDLARECGVAEPNIFILENGMQLTVTQTEAIARKTDWSGNVLVDGRVIDGVDQVVMRDRKHLADDGMLTVILVIEQHSHKIIAGPEIVSRGFVVVDESEDLIQQCKSLVARTFEECDVESKEEWDVVKVAVRKALRRYLAETTDRYPVIIPVVVEI